MSRFIEALRAERTGFERPVYTPLTLKVTELNLDRFRTSDEYEFKVEWKIVAHAERSLFDPLFKNVLLQLREFVYGEFRDRVLRLQQAVLEQDQEKALMEARDLIRVVME